MSRQSLKTLRKLGIQRVPSAQAVSIERKVSARRYGYADAHRRHEPEQTYASSLTDAEWALVRDLFENPAGRGLPPTINRRQLVDACCYVVRTGCSWRMLPVAVIDLKKKPFSKASPKSRLRRRIKLFSDNMESRRVLVESSLRNNPSPVSSLKLPFILGLWG